MSSASNCGRVCMCVFLLPTAYHRNGKPVSICKPQTGWMLHVATFSGNVVMDGVVHFPRVAPLHPRCLLGSQQLIFGCWQGSYHQQDILVFTLHSISAWVSPFYTPTISMKGAPPLNVDLVLLFPCPLLKIAGVALTRCLKFKVKMWWKYSACIAEMNARSVKTT